METQTEKVYVAVGNDIQDGFKTLAWTLRRWNSQAISIVLLHVAYNISKDFVYTPFGKLPVSAVSEEKLEVLRKYEQEKTDKLLSKYIAFCGKVKTEILKVEKYDEPIHKLIVDLMSGLRIGKLVMGMTFMKSSSWRSKSAISGSFYVHQYKPHFCELYIICGGKLVVLKGNIDEGFMEDDQGIMVAKIGEKPSLRNLLGKIFSENSSSRRQKCSCPPPSNQDSPKNQWEDNVQELDNYFQHLLSLNLDEENDHLLQTNPVEPDSQENTNSNMNAEEKMETLQSKIDEAHETIQLKRKEAKANAERHAKAEWAIILCNTRAEELETQIKEEVTKRLEIRRILDIEKEQLHEVIRDVEESKNRLNSLMELQAELSSKLQISSMARAHAEAQLEKAVVTRAEMVREIEELRRQRDVLQRRIEFCREKDALGMVARLTELSCSYREYTAEDIRLATDGFSERLRLKSGGDWLNVYRGRINHSTVAIKTLVSANRLSQQDFQAEVRLLNDIRHPHLVAMMGFCSELQCIIYEYMHNGSLRDILFASQRNCRKTNRNRVLGWHDRIRIAHEVCSGLAFLHLAEPRPIVHGQLTPSNILLDRNLVAKISGYGMTQHHDQYDLRSDIRALGVLLMHMLTGGNWAGLIEDDMMIQGAALARVLDEKAGKWPLDLAVELAGISMKCLSVSRGLNTDLQIATVMKELDELKKKADELVARGGLEVVSKENVGIEDSSDVPGVFLCPIFQEVMKNPHVAADGFSYELEAIDEWFKLGHDTSPMTNLSLKHKFLTPNHTLRCLIQEWQNKGSNLPC
ncbi:U-box domain-containing protein kinase family protein, putative [Theobroma cacao]|uniref:RING-type E3 ubiquitin transferase n=1 Tax=Theobroma cacao TaxID=3641 RepID=A0A061DI55_THECC|nr:U-box domain-containing protein kinase family protein, putative [Theobroma cacao]